MILDIKKIRVADRFWYLTPAATKLVFGLCATGKQSFPPMHTSFPCTAQTILALVFLLQSTVTFSQDFNCSPPTFFKRWGHPNRNEMEPALIRSGDGNLYLAGQAGGKMFIQKINFAGEQIWMRSFELTPNFDLRFVRIIEDSDGMIVGCATQDHPDEGSRGFAFRYDPAANSFLWAYSIASEAPKIGGILEKTPGGNFIFYQNPNTDFDLMFIDYEIEILELDRATGNIVPGFAKRYGYFFKDEMRKMVMVNGALYGLGISTRWNSFDFKAHRLLLARFDPTDGTPIWAQLSHTDTISKADFEAHDLAVDGDALIAAYTMDEDASTWPAPDGSSYHIFLQKTDLDGNVLWIRKYELTFSNGDLNLLVVPDGYVLSSWGAVFKVDKNGEFLWGRSTPGLSISLLTFFRGLSRAVAEGDSLYFFGEMSIIGGGANNHDMYFWKMLADGNMYTSCDLITPFHSGAVVVQNPVITPISLQHFASPAVAFAENAPWLPDSMAEKIICPQYAPMSLSCPADVETSVVQGASGAFVNYDLPTGTSDCDCPGFEFDLANGFASGSLFPVGETQVCYSAKDNCGLSADCCFSVKVVEDEESPCDTKTIGCMRYDLLGITADAQKRRTYRIRATNNCANKLTYTAIQLPDGIVADAPANFSTYTSPEDRDYEVRNPNFSPFYSIRFKSASAGISNGQWDVFEYTLPAQAQPSYIHVTSRLEPQIFYEAHLNTFNCPVGITPSQNRNNEDLTIFQKFSNLEIYPNPTSGELFSDLSRWQGEIVNIQILDSQGKRIQSLTLNAGEREQPVQLSTQLPNGLYFLQLSTEHGENESARFVLKR